MKAVVIDRYGSAPRLSEVAEPVVGELDVLVQVQAASVNQLDVKIAQGEFRQILPYRLPLILGNDLAGVVAGVGGKVRRFKVGDEVFARPGKDRIGTFAERIAVTEADLALKPTTLSAVEAAALPLTGLTAWQALVERANVQPGDKVLIHAGAGGVGSVAIQLAKHLGATVATTAGARNAEFVRGLGADVVIDYRTQDFAEVLAGYDLVLDSLGGKNLEKSLLVLRPGGRAIGISGPPDPRFAREIGLNPGLRLAVRALSARVRRRARARGVTYEFLFMRADGEQLGRLAHLVDDRVLKPVVAGVFGLAEVPAAFHALTEGGVRGKVVIDVAGGTGPLAARTPRESA